MPPPASKPCRPSPTHGGWWIVVDGGGGLWWMVVVVVVVGVVMVVMVMVVVINGGGGGTRRVVELWVGGMVGCLGGGVAPSPCPMCARALGFPRSNTRKW